MSLKVTSAIMCDEARVEESGKHSLIGVYVDSIISDKLPMTTSVCFWLEFAPYGADKTVDLEMKLQIPGLKKPATQTISQFELQESSFCLLVLRYQNFELVEPGQLSLVIRESGGRWRSVLSRNVVLDENIGA